VNPDSSVVRRATEKDTGFICEIDRKQIGTSERRKYLTHAIRNKQCFVVKEGRKCIGFAVVDQGFYGQSFIWLLVVDRGHRRRGVASSLIHHIESTCTTNKLFTSTNKSNLIMQRLMDKLGFERSGYIDNLDEDDPEIVYFKRLKHSAHTRDEIPRRHPSGRG